MQDFEKQLPPPCVLRTWTTASQHAFWAWRFAHWERKKLKDCQVCPCQRLSVLVFLRVPCCVQAACRQLGLWPGGDLRDIRRRLTLHEYAPTSLSATDIADFHAVNHQTVYACSQELRTMFNSQLQGKYIEVDYGEEWWLGWIERQEGAQLLIQVRLYRLGGIHHLIGMC